jgi:uncharacterized membrane protein YraQ (UPF0718 family)
MQARAARRALILLAFVAVAVALCVLPAGSGQQEHPLMEGVRTAQVYVQQHLLYALLPALALASIISVSISKTSVITHMGSAANRFIAYGVAAASGTVLSVCSCSVLPLFAGIRRIGAGLGPAVAFLFAGPAINVMAIILTARVLGWSLGLARALSAVALAIVAGLIMGRLFGDKDRAQPPTSAAVLQEPSQPIWRVGLLVASLIAITVFLTWSPAGFTGILRCCPGGPFYADISGEYVGQSGGRFVYRDASGAQQIKEAALVEQIRFDSSASQWIYERRFALAAVAASAMATMVIAWFGAQDVRRWLSEGWLLARQIVPLFLLGVFASGFLLGRPGHEGLVPSQWIAQAVGGNSILSNLAAALLGAVLYLATLTEVPLVQGLVGSGMGQGPALALLLSGPAVSLPSVLVLVSLVGWRKAAVYLVLVIVLATVAGSLYGKFLT